MEVVERNKAASYGHTVNDTYEEWEQSGLGASKAMLVFYAFKRFVRNVWDSRCRCRRIQQH